MFKLIKPSWKSKWESEQFGEHGASLGGENSSPPPLPFQNIAHLLKQKTFLDTFGGGGGMGGGVGVCKSLSETGTWDGAILFKISRGMCQFTSIATTSYNK